MKRLIDDKKGIKIMEFLDPVWAVLIVFFTLFHLGIGFYIFTDGLEWYLDKWEDARLLGCIWMALLTLFFIPEVIVCTIIYLIIGIWDYIKNNSFHKNEGD